MKRCLLVVFPVLCLAALSGCQCSRLTEKSTDVIDFISDHPPELDALYHPCFDLTRIGHPDWCCCGFNRWWCRRACCHPHGKEPCPLLDCPFCLQEKPICDEPATKPSAPPASAPLRPIPPAPAPPSKVSSATPPPSGPVLR